MEEAGFSETSVTIYRATRRHIPEDRWILIRHILVSFYSKCHGISTAAFSFNMKTDAESLPKEILSQD
jgi:hypothetical protein